MNVKEDLHSYSNIHIKLTYFILFLLMESWSLKSIIKGYVKGINDNLLFVK